MHNLFFLLFFLLFLIPHKVEAQITLQRNLPKVDFLEDRLNVPIELIPNYRDLMRDMISDLSVYAKGRDPNFMILTHEGLYLLIRGEWEENLDELKRIKRTGIVYDDDEKFLREMFQTDSDLIFKVGTPIRRYLHNLDGVVISGMYCHHNPPDEKTMKIINLERLAVLGIEHCAQEDLKNQAVKKAAAQKIALHLDQDLQKNYDLIPQKMILENANNIDSLKDVQNMLIMTDSRKYGNRAKWVLALSDTNYDLLIIDPFYRGREALTKEDLAMLKFKKLGAKRKVLAKVDLTTAEDFRFYWKSSWRLGRPSWLRMVSRDNPAGLVVEYWNPEWKAIIGNYVKGILDLGFDGILFDGLDAHLRFEKLTPID